MKSYKVNLLIQFCFKSHARAVTEYRLYNNKPAVVASCYFITYRGMAHTLFLLGTTIMEGWQRRVQPQAISNASDLPETMKRFHGVQEYLRQREKDRSASLWLILDRAEAALAKRISLARMWVRLGPALGLAGTLIPLGSALTALAANDLQLLSERLILAFVLP